jgi:hypothetical protein
VPDLAAVWQQKRILIRLSSPLGGLQDDLASFVTGNPPLLDFFHRAKTAEADEVIIQTAISYTRRLSGMVDGGH